MNHLKDFQNPPAAFRGAPFWAWNTKLNKEQTLRQLEYFKEMGLGGVTLHVRTGLDTPYMGDEFMDIVKACVQRAKELDMKIYLYDEDRWPSGAGGGAVTKDVSMRAKYLLFTPISYDEREELLVNKVDSRAFGGATGQGKLLAKYDIQLEDGCLKSYRRLQENETGDNVWYAYLETSIPSPWFNNQAYVDTLSRPALERFLETTHEKYYALLGEDFGGVIPSIFTDEPQFMKKTTLGRAADRDDLVLPYTTDFEETFHAATGESLLMHLPEVVWELPQGKVSPIRYHYHDHVAERFAEAFSDTVGQWCRAHGIALTGHMMEEPTLRSQTEALGEAMRHYRGFDVPGIDMLCDWREYTTAKQAQSASHQLGSVDVTSELYGVTNWTFDFRGHKLQGDWQAALGVTRRVQHLSWMSMEGEAKRDYPASIFYQSPWYKKYPLVEDYFGRINTALCSGKPDVRIGVIHPVESYWLYFGPEEQTAPQRAKLENQFSNVTQWLLKGFLDFDFLSESLLQTLPCKDAKGFSVGEMEYDTIVVPGCVTLRESTLQRLSEFAARGGKLLFMGDIPTLVDAKPDNRVQKLAADACQVPFDQEALMQALQHMRFFDMRNNRGLRATDYVSQLRSLDGGEKVLFIANAAAPGNSDIPKCTDYTITLQGEYQVTQLCAMNGSKTSLSAVYENGKTLLEVPFWQQDSLLLLLTPGTGTQTEPVQDSQFTFVCDLDSVGTFTLEEPNVLMLDQAAWQLNGGAVQPKEESLRVDTAVKRLLGYPTDGGNLAQPWVEPPVVPEHDLRLVYDFTSDIPLSGAKLAIERVRDIVSITLNGNAVDLSPTGWYVDESIHTLALPEILSGKNTLVVELKYGRKTSVEWCYILGDFGVEVTGSHAKITALPSVLGFGDITAQGLPFYGGNLTYRREVALPAGEYSIQIPKYRNSLLSVRVNGKEIGDIAYAPYCLSFTAEEGQTIIEIVAYGNRANTFGPVHCCDELVTWFGPGAWRVTGTEFAYEYQLSRTGILKAPILLKTI